MWGNSGIVTCVPFFLDQAIGVEGGMPAVGLSEHSTRFFYRKIQIIVLRMFMTLVPLPYKL